MWHASGKRCTDVLLEKFKGKRPFGTQKCTCENIMKAVEKEIGWKILLV
jgi:hypothetical protein